MPIFVFLSGYLYFMLKDQGRYGNLRLFYWNKTKRILIPYIVWGVVIVLLFQNFYTFKNLLSGICHLWFLLMLFVIFLIIPAIYALLNKIKNRNWQVILLALTFVFGALLAKVGIFGIAKIAYFLPFFLLGFFVHKYELTFLKNISLWIGLIGVAAILFLLNRDGLVSTTSKQICSFAVVMLVCAIPEIRLSEKFSNIIKVISKNSMGIYLFHHIIIWLIILDTPFRSFLDSHIYIGCTILFLITFISSLLLSLLFNKYKITRVLIGSK